MKGLLPLLAATMVFAGSARAQAVLPADLAKAVHDYDQAQIHGDEAELNRLLADGAVMGGVATLTGLSADTRFKVTLRFSDIWAKRNGTWQVIYTHASRQPG